MPLPRAERIIRLWPAEPESDGGGEMMRGCESLASATCAR